MVEEHKVTKINEELNFTLRIGYLLIKRGSKDLAVLELQNLGYLPDTGYKT